MTLDCLSPPGLRARICVSYREGEPGPTSDPLWCKYSQIIFNPLQKSAWKFFAHLRNTYKGLIVKLLKSVIVIAAAGLTLAAGVQAQTTATTDSGFSMYSPGSRYIGFNAGKSNFKLNNGLGAFPSDSKDTSYSLYGGSYFNQNFGMELGYTDFGRVSRAGGSTRANGINLSVVGRLPVSPSFNVLGKLGTTYGRTDVSAAPGSGVTSGRETGFGVSYGLGVEYAFTPAVSGVLQYDEHKLRFVNSGRDTVGTASVGLRYNF